MIKETKNSLVKGLKAKLKELHSGYDVPTNPNFVILTDLAQLAALSVEDEIHAIAIHELDNKKLITLTERHYLELIGALLEDEDLLMGISAKASNLMHATKDIN